MDAGLATVIVGILSLVGTLIGSITGILVSQKLTVYRIDQLEKKVDKINNNVTEYNDRILVLERDNKVIWKTIDEIKLKIEKEA
jgi:MFS superfamily sulfate permease-like transporter